MSYLNGLRNRIRWIIGGITLTLLPVWVFLGAVLAEARPHV